MKKAVLISIRPQWCAKIASGEKTIEFRKSRPELKKPFKCYIYCTKADYYTWDLRVSNVTIPFAEKCCGKVIGEFICSDFVLFNGGKKWPDFRENRAQAEAATPEVLKKACLTARELWAYEPKGNPIGWCISDLVIYDTPHELNSFRRVCPEELDCESCAMHSENTGRCGNEALYLRRARRAGAMWRNAMTYERAAEILDPEHRETYESLEIVNEACRMGVEALRRRVPESPYPDGDAGVMACPSCGSGEYLHNEDGNRCRFCGQCGQAIDWDGSTGEETE